jgi:hypothetical protein
VVGAVAGAGARGAEVGAGGGGCGLLVLGGASFMCAMCEGRGLRGALMRDVCRNKRVRV